MDTPLRIKPDYLGDFLENGFVILKGVVPKRRWEQLAGQIDGLKPLYLWDDGFPNHRFKNVFNRESWWLEWWDLPQVIALAEAVLGPDCHVIGDTAWKSLRGHQGSPCHLDYIPGVLTPDQAALFTWPPFICTAHFFPHPLTEELGPTRVLPGSHRFGGNFRELDRYQSVFPEPGDCLFFRSDLLHGGGANLTDGARYLLQVHYSSRWIAQRWTQPGWEWNPSVLAAASDRQLRLLGEHRKSQYD